MRPQVCACLNIKGNHEHTRRQRLDVLDILRGAPKDWEHKNIGIVIETGVPDRHIIPAIRQYSEFVSLVTADPRDVRVNVVDVAGGSPHNGVQLETLDR